MTTHQLGPRTRPSPAEHRARKEQAKELREQKPNYYQLEKYKSLRYDYGLIAEEHRQQVQAAAVEIGKRGRRMVEDAIQIGEQLLAVKALLPHGQFADWWQTEFDFGTRSIQEMMNMARRFAGKSAIIAHLTQTTARLLAAPSVPDEAVDAVIVQAQAKGEVLSVAEVRRIVTPYKPPRLPKPKQLPAPSEPDVIEAEYTIVPKHEFIFPQHAKRADEVQPVISRQLAAKLRDGIFTRIFKEFFDGDERDELLIALTRALEE